MVSHKHIRSVDDDEDDESTFASNQYMSLGVTVLVALCAGVGIAFYMKRQDKTIIRDDDMGKTTSESNSI